MFDKELSNEIRRGGYSMNNEKLQNIKLKVVGVTFNNDDGTSRQEIIKAMTKDAPVTLTREPNNKYDPNAIMVSSIDGQVGYIGKEYVKILAPMMDNGRKFSAVVDTIDYYKNTHYLHIVIKEE